jgi:hypothetical protein
MLQGYMEHLIGALLCVASEGGAICHRCTSMGDDGVVVM